MKRQVRDYVIMQEVGKGMFSTVYLCEHLQSKETYACKKYTRSKMTRTSLKNLEDEIKVLSNLPKSDHIIKLHEIIKTDNHFYLIIDYCNGGDLFSLLERRLILKEAEVRIIF